MIVCNVFKAFHMSKLCPLTSNAPDRRHILHRLWDSGDDFTFNVYYGRFSCGAEDVCLSPSRLLPEA